jgi:peptidoglycan hydrolase-like protein with peptidoglycan-binding domain
MLNFLEEPGNQGNQLKVDGIFGPKTHARVVSFQKTARVPADGIVGPVTGSALVAGVMHAIFAS